MKKAYHLPNSHSERKFSQRVLRVGLEYEFCENSYWHLLKACLWIEWF